MNFIDAVSVFITSIFTTAVTDCMMLETPCIQLAVNAVFISMNLASWLDVLLNERLYSGLLNIFQHPNDYRPTSLHHPEHWLFFLFQRASPWGSLQPTASPRRFFYSQQPDSLCGQQRYRPRRTPLFLTARARRRGPQGLHEVARSSAERLRGSGRVPWQSGRWTSLNP